MKDETRTKKELISELAVLRQRISELEKSKTQYKQVTNHFRKEHSLLQTLMDNIPDSIYFKDKKNRFVRVNKAKAEHSGITSEKMIGKTDFDFYPEKQAKESFADDTRVMESGKPLIGKVEKITHLNRRDHWVSTTKIPWYEEKKIIGIIGITRDITERKQAQDKLAQKTQELTRSNTELEQFAYIASHDLQEPLRMVSSFTQLLARRYKEKLGPEADEFIAYIEDGAKDMQELINDLLSLSRITTQTKPFKRTDCENVLDKALTILKVSIEESGAAITHDPLPTIMADSSQLTQLFQNLISNAIKFQGDKPAQIHISAKQKKNEWIFSVQDNGIGMDPKYAERIFLAFQRLHSRDEYPGTGIGLATCKKIVERHGGQIWVESEPDKGSIFYFTIPIRKVKKNE